MKIFSLIFSLFVGGATCFQNQNNFKLKPIRSKPVNMLNVHELNGIDIGIPLNLFQNLFTNIHYGHDITTVKTTALQFLIGYYTYGKDRFKDALEYEEKPFETKKKSLYEFLIKNKDIYAESYNISLSLILVLLLFDHNYINNLPFIPLLLTSEYYKQIKENYGSLKSAYVSVMWTMSCIILPCVLHDNNFDILNYPLDYLPCFLTIFASSNLNDIKDIEEDKENNIDTLPVVIGKENTNYLVLFSLAASSLLYGINDHYLDKPLINSLFELQNAGVAFIPYLNEKKSLKK